MELLRDRGVDIRGLQRRAGSHLPVGGRYGYDLNEAKTLDTQLNVFADFRPTLDDAQARVPVSSSWPTSTPSCSCEVLRQMRGRPRLVALDTMNFWIQGKREALLRVLREVDLVTINDGEARQLAERAEPHQGRARRSRARARAPSWSSAASTARCCSTRTRSSCVPAFPLEDVVRSDRGRGHLRRRLHGLHRVRDRVDAADDAARRWSTAR